MIQSAIYFVLGFLVAGFLALLVAPAIWRRAVYLTRKRIESAVPLTANEIQAEKDKLRAEHAIELCKTEAALSKQRNKSIEQANMVAEQSGEIKLYAAEVASQAEANRNLEKVIVSVNSRLKEREDQLANIKTEMSAKSAELTTRNSELDNLRRLYKDADFKNSQTDEKISDLNLQIAKLSATASDLRERRQRDRDKMRESSAENRANTELLKNERVRAEKLQKDHDRLLAQNSDLEDKLDRRGKEIERLKERKAGVEQDASTVENQLAENEGERKTLEKELGAVTARYNEIVKAADNKNPAKLIESLNAKIGKFEADIKSLTEQRDALRNELSKKPEPAAAKNGDGDDALREQLSQLAAEVVHMTAIVEGKASPINSLVQTDAGNKGNDVTSLAERIKALKSQASKAAE